MTEWLTIAENLPLNQKSRTDCPQCGLGTNTNAALVSHSVKGFSIYCFACDLNEFHSKGAQSLADIKRIKELNELAEQPITKLELPDDYTTEIPATGRLWLYKASISESQWRRYRIGYSERYERVVLPVYDSSDNLTWFQCRAIHDGQKPKYLQPSRDKGGVLFASGHQHDNKLVVITEDILSAIRIGKFVQTRCILGTKINTGQINNIASFDKVVTWLDSDRPGRRGSSKIRKSVGLVTEVANIITEKDPKLLTNEQIEAQINAIRRGSKCLT